MTKLFYKKISTGKIKWILCLIIFLNLGYSFYQHYHKPLDGDMSENIIPTPTIGYYHVLQDPLGLDVLLYDKVYPNPNRFFAHWSVSEYFLNVPLLLQYFTNPVESVYLSAAIAKMLTQILILYLLSVFISNRTNIYNLNFLIAFALLIPLFQTSDNSRYMGIIDQSVVYTFFYALPIGLLLLFYLPFYKNLYWNEKLKFSSIKKIFMALFIIVLTLNGPLGPGAILIICSLVLISLWWNNYKQFKSLPPSKRFLKSIMRIPNYMLFYFIGISIMSLYSLFIGQGNTLTINNSVPIIDRYARLPLGIYYIVTQKIGLPLLLVSIFINILLIKKYYKTAKGNKIINFLKWIGVFSLLYILLLPLGGYRPYREYIIRYDTILPIILGLFYMFGVTTLYLINEIPEKIKSIYLSSIVVILVIFTLGNTPKIMDYKCERNAIETLARSQEKIVELPGDYPIMEWEIITEPSQSELNSTLFQYWNITDKKKLYFQNKVDD